MAILAPVAWSERWFDDFAVGDAVVVGEHLMAEDRIMEFAAEFDPQRFHTDPVAAEQTLYGGLIASGWHTGSVMMRMFTELLGPASLGSSGGRELRWTHPVRPGDVLRLKAEVLAVRASQRRPDRGTVTVRLDVMNQDDVVVMSFEPDLLLSRRPT